MPTIKSGIDLSSAAQTDVLVSTTAAQRFKAVVSLIPSTTGEFSLTSGSTTVAHVQVGVAGGHYVFEVESDAAGDDLSLVRVGAMAMGGQVEARVTP